MQALRGSDPWISFKIHTSQIIFHTPTLEFFHYTFEYVFIISVYQFYK